MLTVADIGTACLRDLATTFGARLELVRDGRPIPGSFWGEPEAGLRGGTVFVRSDTPVHSFLHEFCHFLCMDDDRRRGLDTNAGGDDLEEAAVCYLQIVLADELPGVGSERLMQDMDDWGYSFRLGATAAWFQSDAVDALDWLRARGILDEAGRPTGGLCRHLAAPADTAGMLQPAELER